MSLVKAKAVPLFHPAHPVYAIATLSNGILSAC